MKSKVYKFRNRPFGIAAFWLKSDLHLLFSQAKTIILLVICTFFTSACGETPCISDPETLIGIEFCDATASGIVSKKYPINGMQIRNSQVFNESVLQSATSFKIKFPSNSDSFWLSFLDSTSKDSIRFSYSRTMEFAGESCGFYYGFKDLKSDSMAGANFDRVQILTNQGDSSNKVHVRIFW